MIHSLIEDTLMELKFWMRVDKHELDLCLLDQIQSSHRYKHS